MKIVSLWLLLICFEESYSQHNQHWFAFKPGINKTTSAINMSQWLDKPAGRHGFLQYRGKDFVFEDGTKTKFWGVNIASNSPFVKEEEATRWTNFMAGYGINAVRFHKFTWEATDGIHSTQLTNEKWKNFDADLWEEVGDEAESKIEPNHPLILGGELSKNVARKAIINILEANLGKQIEIRTSAFEDLEAPEGGGILIMNPPYGESMDKEEDIFEAYKIVGHYRLS
jgi:hypothetical protein